MRINYVKKARKEQGTCESCHQTISAGDGYKYVSPRYGAKRKRHTDCPTWRQSELTNSKLATVYAAVEDFDAEVGKIATPEDVDGTDAFAEEVTAALQSVADAAREVAEEYQASIDNMPEAFQETSSTAEDMRDKIEQLEQFADDLEGFDPPEFEGVDEGTDEAELDEALEDWANEVVSAAQDAVSEFGL